MLVRDKHRESTVARLVKCFDGFLIGFSLLSAEREEFCR